MPNKDLVKIIIFILIQLMSCFIFLIGIIPTIILILGYFLTKRTNEISAFLYSIKLCKYYVFLLSILILSITFIMYLFNLFQVEIENLFFAFIIFVFLNVYLIFLLKFLYKPIEKYSDEVVKNGIFGYSNK